jgi:exo-beta-1,3-glucanase (GH17 family)/cellulose synthase/poly-beta-1,6-N-acetylglucosamine synthase-like glycosyltransferase
MLIVATLNLGLWAIAFRAQAVSVLPNKLSGMAYAPFRQSQSPLTGKFPSLPEIEQDLKLLQNYTRAIRLYSVQELPEIPVIAEKYGLKVNQGAWLNRDLENNQRELDALYRAVQRSPNINAAIIGNETILRGDLSIAQLKAYLDQARERLDIPVSTAENWDLWLNLPELVEHVDYIAVHLLPYWEGVPASGALARAKQRLHQIRTRYPNKTIVVAEYGWPSQGERFFDALPNNLSQAQFVREFTSYLQAQGIDSYVMEAIDQPWKASQEGKVGAYWGMWNQARELKWDLQAPVASDPHWIWKALIATVLAAPMVLLFARQFGRFKWWGRAFQATLFQVGLNLLVWLVGVPMALYLSPLDWWMFVLLLPAQIAIVGILWATGFEFVEAVAQKHWLRRSGLSPPDLAASSQAKVSIHLPCYNEPPEMVILTLQSLANLDYPNFEVMVIDNNTEKDEIWQPVRDKCAELGPRFRFFHLSPWPGFKAGALNFALQETAIDAEIIAVVDSDYVVRADWLTALVGHFNDPKVVVVQCPQAHRDFEQSAFRRLCNFEYDGFFRIGMHHRNERNAIIQHGTMTMVRKSALIEVGAWAEWCICEDAELGLKLMQHGFDLVYVDEVMGRGLTPADFTAYKSQRFRWAFGAMQILKKHIGSMLKASKLTIGQRYHFLTGWFGWFADALHLVFSIMAIIWTLGMVINQDLFAKPLAFFLLPVLGMCLLKAVFGIVLYRVRVPCSWRDCLGASLASMALSHAIARGIWKGLFSSSHPFERTAKSRRLRKKPSALTAVREESLILIALLLASLAFSLTPGGSAPEARLWIAILIAQSLPYGSAVAVAWIAARASK